MARRPANAGASKPAEDRKHALEIAKLELEMRALEHALSPQAQRVERIKAYAGLGGVLAGFAALLTFTLSYWQTSNQLGAARDAKVEERLDKALERIAAKDPATKLSGIGALRGFLAEPRRDRGTQRLYLLTTLAHLLSVEEEPIVRRALIDSFAAIPPADTLAKRTALAALVESSRSLVTEEKLRLTRAFGEPTRSPELRAMSVADAIVRVVRLGVNAPDLSDIYCRGCDFHGLPLADARFDGAVLDSADFSDADLQRASFDGADIEGVEFVAADLRQARFLQSKAQRRSWFAWRAEALKANFDAPPDTVERIDIPFDREARTWWIAPVRFDCADLRKARFEGFPLFPLNNRAVTLWEKSPVLLASAPTFADADLDAADFSGVSFFGSASGYSGVPVLGSWRMGAEMGEDVVLWETVDARPSSDLLDPELERFSSADEIAGTENYKNALQRIGTNLRAAHDWQAARLPGEWKSLLFPSTETKGRSLFKPDDLHCKPRNR